MFASGSEKCCCVNSRYDLHVRCTSTFMSMYVMKKFFKTKGCYMYMYASNLTILRFLGMIRRGHLWSQP